MDLLLRFLSSSSPRCTTPVPRWGWIARCVWVTACLWATVPLVAQTVPTVSFTDVTRSTEIDFTLESAVSLPGLLPTEQARFGAGAAVCDYDCDGDLDVYLVAHAGQANRLYRNDGGGSFVDVTAATGVGDLGWGHMALFLDLDGDRYDDLVVFNDAVSAIATPSVEVYRNVEGSRFERRKATGIDAVLPIVGGATAGDYDHDGDLDLYVVGWWNNVNYLYRNDGDFTFTEVTFDAGLRVLETLVPHWTPVFVDVNGDGWQDLFGAVDFAPDYLFINQQDGTFLLSPQVTSVQNDMGVAVGDFDRDGDQDLFTTNITDVTAPAPGCCNWLYVNDGNGNFTNEAGARGVAASGWAWGAAFADLDLDTDLDLMVVNGWFQLYWLAPSTVFLNDGTGQFDDVGAASGFDHVGNTHGLTPFDYDNDGDLDALIVDAFGQARLIRTDPREAHHWLRVQLVGTESNPNGVGARVELTLASGGRPLVREIIVGGSTYAGPPLEAHFGLGTETSGSLRVVWPSGIVQDLGSVSADQRLVVVEP